MAPEQDLPIVLFAAPLCGIIITKDASGAIRCEGEVDGFGMNEAIPRHNGRRCKLRRYAKETGSSNSRSRYRKFFKMSFASMTDAVQLESAASRAAGMAGLSYGYLGRRRLHWCQQFRRIPIAAGSGLGRRVVARLYKITPLARHRPV
jgi:hypothetical protein